MISCCLSVGCFIVRRSERERERERDVKTVSNVDPLVQMRVKKTLKWVGVRTHPCVTPFLISKVSVTLSREPGQSSLHGRAEWSSQTLMGILCGENGSEGGGSRCSRAYVELYIYLIYDNSFVKQAYNLEHFIVFLYVHIEFFLVLII